mmetsp:Transcript_100458/g.322305  ORF Transcript_100458/g.322305 Transcript_100458/m.322305 type:complete len:202 (+) Transcript_100458:45-650(+)
MTGEPAICEPGGKGLLLPWNDYHWPNELRAFLYALAMVYSFLGVAIVADIFMAAIEAVTKRREQVVLTSGTIVTVYLWNDTVASLSLMALGSSAPEIFLSCIDLLRRGMHSSELGSATIVGSAAFNLLVIIAVCIACIPAGEKRHIEYSSGLACPGRSPQYIGTTPRDMTRGSNNILTSLLSILGPIASSRCPPRTWASAS